MADRDIDSFLSQYMDEKDMARIKAMKTMNKEEFMLFDVKNIKVEQTPQVLFGCTYIFNECPEAEDFPVACAIISNAGNEEAGYKALVTVDHYIVSEMEGSVGAGSVTQQTLKIDGYKLSPLKGNSVQCTVTVTDLFGREISSSVGRIRVTEKSSDMPNIVMEPSQLEPNYTSITSHSKEPVSILLKVQCDSKTVYATALEMPPGSTLSFDISKNIWVSSAAGKKLEVSAEYDLKAIPIKDNKHPSPSGQAASGNAIGLPSMSILKCYAECRCLSVLDLQSGVNGMVDIGSIKVSNQETSPFMLNLRVLMNGVPLTQIRLQIAPGKDQCANIHVPVKTLAQDDTHTESLRILLTDDISGTILDRSFSVIIRSKFDTQLNKLDEQVPRIVNPLDPAVQSFVVDSNGPLAKAMKGSFEVMGYQSERMVVPQIKAVYDAVKELKLHYVSDTTTYKSGSTFQRIRDPATVLSDRSGNCIELSILFASIFEAMGFEPVMIYPYGHALVGVVLGTDIYRSRSRTISQLSEQQIDMLISGKKARVLCIESTCCTSDISFDSAVHSAHNTVIKELKTIIDTKDFTFIKQKREQGINPNIN